MKKRFKKRMLRSLLCLLLALLFCASAVSCSAPSAEQETDTLTVTDVLGRSVTVPKQPRRVAALLGSFADVWLLAGGSLCAAADDAWEDFGLELGDAVNLGGAHSPDVERLLSSEPQLVLASASTASNVALLDTLEAVGIPVVYFDVDCFEDYLSMLRLCTELTGRADLYEQNGLCLQAQIEAVKARYAAAELSETERTVLLLRASSGSVKAKGSEGTVLGEMLADMGCINPADSDSSLLENLSVEAVLREEPHHIFVVTMGSNTDAAMASLDTMIKENPAWNTLTAVREGRLHVMDKTLFNLKPNARWAEAYETLYETLTNQ